MNNKAILELCFAVHEELVLDPDDSSVGKVLSMQAQGFVFDP